MAVEKFDSYRELVFQYYLKKKQADQLEDGLLEPTPAALKGLCKILCDTRLNLAEEKDLKDFLGPFDDKATCLKAINRVGTDKFRPLWKYLTGRTKKAERETVKLLAWMIDFRPRPYDHTFNYGIIDLVQPNEGEEERDDNQGRGIGKDLLSDVSDQKRSTWLRAKQTLTAALLLIPIGIFSYWIWNNKGGCMYWAGDHYEQVSCSQKVGNDTLVVALDKEKMSQFKKITRPDTITTKSVGKVWCVKINGRYEYFTADGMHPTEIQYRLKPLSNFIFNNHLDTGLKVGQVPNFKTTP